MNMLLFDATKTFDIVKYSKLFNLHIEKEIFPLIVRLLLNVYLISTAFVSWNDVNSDQFNLCNGMRQVGCDQSFTFLSVHKSFTTRFKQK